MMHPWEFIGNLSDVELRRRLEQRETPEGWVEYAIQNRDVPEVLATLTDLLD